MIQAWYPCNVDAPMKRLNDNNYNNCYGMYTDFARMCIPTHAPIKIYISRLCSVADSHRHQLGTASRDHRM